MNSSIRFQARVHTWHIQSCFFSVLCLWSVLHGFGYHKCRQNFNIRQSKFQNWNVSSLALQLSCTIHLSQMSRMKMQLEQRPQPMPWLHLSDEQFYCLLRCILHERFDGITKCIKLILSLFIPTYFCLLWYVYNMLCKPDKWCVTLGEHICLLIW